MRPKVHVRKGDTVLVIAGKDRGKKGKVLRVFPAKGTVLVGVLILSRSICAPRPSYSRAVSSTARLRFTPATCSNICSRCGKPARTGRNSSLTGAACVIAANAARRWIIGEGRWRACDLKEKYERSSPALMQRFNMGM